MASVRDAHLMDRILDLGLKPHAEAIAEIAAKGDVAVVVFEPHRSIVEAARSIGWDGHLPVFRLSRSVKRRLAATLDPVTTRWLDRTKSGVRVFLFSGKGTMLVNNDERGWSVEQGSADTGRPS